MLNRLPSPLNRLLGSSFRLKSILVFALALGLLLVTYPSSPSISILPSSWSQKHRYPPYMPKDQSDNGGDSQPGGEGEEGLNLSLLPEYYVIPFGKSLRFPQEVFDTPLLRPLGRRLHSFLTRADGWDLEESNRLNEKGCPRRNSDNMVNPDQYFGEIDYWNKISTDDIAERRAQVVRWLEKRISAGEKVIGEWDDGEGRGIVMTAGNQDTTLRMITVLKHLKRLGVELPVEVFHYKDELHDQNQRREIESFGAVIREIEGVGKQDNAWKNWQIKGLAIVQSAFREVLYLDSDNTPLRDPTHLFDAPLYADHGRAVFWPDLSKDHPHNAIWRLVGETCTLDSFTFESGQIVIDKAGNGGLNLAALLIAAEMQADRDFWFHMCGGDKDTFRWAFRILGIEFGESPRWMSALGFLNTYEGGRFCGHTVLQYDLVVPEGFTREPPLFIHSNLLKHLGNSGLNSGNSFTHVKRMSDDSVRNPALNYAHSFVYQGAARGMCLDLEMHGNAAEDLSETELLANTVDTVEVGDVEGGVFEGFAEAFFQEGGRIGGW